MYNYFLLLPNTLCILYEFTQFKKYILLFRWYSSMKWPCNEKYQIDFKPWKEELND